MQEDANSGPWLRKIRRKKPKTTASHSRLGQQSAGRDSNLTGQARRGGPDPESIGWEPASPNPREKPRPAAVGFIAMEAADRRVASACWSSAPFATPGQVLASTAAVRRLGRRFTLLDVGAARPVLGRAARVKDPSRPGP